MKIPANMRKTIYALATAVYFTGTMLTGCQSSAENAVYEENNKQAEKENILAAKQDLFQAHQDSITEYQKFRLEYDERIIANEKTLADYKARIANENKENRAPHEKRLALLEQKNNDLKQKLSNYYEDGENAWGSFKSEFSQEMDELGKSLKAI
jgi:predicted RNase H-like nuclease (RuvC/YqgF family)